MKKIIMRHQKGFTLVEASVVLVIIALVIGSIIKAVEFMENARVDRFIKELNGFKGAYYGYQTHRGLYPGDGADLNKYVDYDAVGLDDGTFFADLYDVGLIGSPNPEVPLQNAGYYFVNFLSGSDAVGNTTGAILGKSQICATDVKEKYAIHLDSKLDDRIWNRGSVRSVEPYGTQDRYTVCFQL